MNKTTAPSTNEILELASKTEYPFNVKQKEYEDEEFEDEGMIYANKVSKAWEDGGSIDINQYLFEKSRHFPRSKFKAKQIHIAAIYIYILKTATVKDSLDFEHRKEAYGVMESLDPCWNSNAGTADGHGRRRMGIGRVKMFVYAIVASVLWEGNHENDWSHLCGNARCVRPEHLFSEKRKQNINRISCPGWVYCPKTDEIICLCGCEPRCRKIRVAGSIVSAKDYYK